jgi:hypothetical protein
MAVWSWQTDAEALVHGGTDIMCRSSSGLPTREKRGDPDDHAALRAPYQAFTQHTLG